MNELFLFESGPEFDPARLTEARESKGLNKTELAERIGITSQAISQFEGGSKHPSGETLFTIATALDIPVQFFRATSSRAGLIRETLFFRSFQSATKASNRACSVWAKWTGEIASVLEEWVDLPEVNLPEVSLSRGTEDQIEEQIEELAFECRRHFGMGIGPIKNMVKVLESAGVTAATLYLGTRKIDAFSSWIGGRPFVFLGRDKGSAVRSRFDAAHELGHLILHRHISQDELEDKNALKKIEREADYFAGAFLLPRRSFGQEVYSTRVSDFVSLKERWLVSIQCMAIRCRQIGIFDDDQYLRLRKQLSANNMINREPLDDEIKPEVPTLLARSFDLLHNEAGMDVGIMLQSRLGLSLSSINNITGWVPDDSEELPQLKLI